MTMPIVVMTAVRVSRSGFWPTESGTFKNSDARDGKYCGGFECSSTGCFRTSEDRR